MNDKKADSAMQAKCSRCGRSSQNVASKPGQDVFDVLLGVCPTCKLTFCTDCASSDDNGYACPVHKKELELF